MDLSINPGDTIEILLNANVITTPHVTPDGLLTGFDSGSGTGQIYGTTVPEPGSLILLLGLAVSALAGTLASRVRRAA